MVRPGADAPEVLNMDGNWIVGLIVAAATIVFDTALATVVGLVIKSI